MSTLPRRFDQLDVFTAVPMRGNPLAVVHDAQGLSNAAMADFARWTNLSETTFLLPPTDPAADYRVRIFTPGGELPFAGHPTLGSCFAWLKAGGIAKRPGEVVQQCQAGLIRVRRNAAPAVQTGGTGGAAGPASAASVAGTRLAFAAPPTTVNPVEPLLVGQACTALGLGPRHVLATAWLSNGFAQLVFEVDSAETVLALTPDHVALKQLNIKVGLIGRHPSGSDCDVEVRFFAAPIGVEEDPVTGSLNANLGQWLIAAGRMPARYVAAQGAALGRAGRIHIEHDGQQLWVGGDVVSVIAGSVTL